MGSGCAASIDGVSQPSDIAPAARSLRRSHGGLQYKPIAVDHADCDTSPRGAVTTYSVRDDSMMTSGSSTSDRSATRTCYKRLQPQGQRETTSTCAFPFGPASEFKLRLIETVSRQRGGLN
jgi:hypothetical protein